MSKANHKCRQATKETMKHNLLKSVILSVILLMGVSNVWGIERIYLKLDAWNNSGARYAARFYNDGGKEYWQNMYETSVSQVFACDIPSDGVTYNKVIFVRLNPSGTDNTNGGNNWNNKWNQSGDITFQKNKLCTQGNNWDSWTGSWSSITWYISGSFNSWSTNNSTTSYTLDANTTYEFKVYSPQVGYFSNDGTMERGNHSNWDMFANVGNCSLTTDFAGTYTFTYNGDKMNVTYPAAYKVTYGVGTNKGTASVTTSPKITSDNLVLASTSITFSKGATIEGYTWKGWYSKTDGTGTKLGDGTTYTSTSRTGDISVYACYDLKSYSITYNLNGGSGTMTPTSYNINTATFNLPTPTKTGYTFAGWYDNANLTGNKVTQVAKGSTGDKTYYAKWEAKKYNITWNANGGSVTPASSTYTYDGDPVALPTPTRTGYTFNGWFTASSSGTKISDIGKTNKPTSDKTYYAQWTENKFNVTIETDGNGTTTNSGIQQVGIEGISVTATPNDGYEFVNWTKTGDVTLSNANTTTTTIKATGTGSVTANFKKIDYKTIYLKPGAWASSNAKFAIYASSGNEGESYNMEQSDCNNEHYQCDINGKYNTINIRRMSDNGTVIWNEIKNLTIPEEGMCFYDRTKLYLKPNANWKQADARFAAYFYLNSDGEKHKWMSMLATDEEGVFYCDYPTEYAYDRVIFCRMDPATVENDWNNKWNQTKNIDLFTGGNLYAITEGHWGDNQDNGATGTWSYIWKEPTYPLTLKATPYGEFTVKCNNVSHTSSRTKDIVINLPFESTIEITQSTSYHNAYNNNLIIKTSSSSAYAEATLNTTYTLCGATTIQENFATTEAHKVYLRIPTAVATEWNATSSGGAHDCIYSFHTLNSASTGDLTTMTVATDAEIAKESGYTYLVATIPAGCHTFRFERKKSSKEGAPINRTENFVNLLPLEQSNCFTIEGKNIDKGTFYGSWGLSTANGDFRVLYVEQQVAHGTDENAWKTVINTTYQHSSDIIKQGNADDRNIVSLHVKRNKALNPEIVLQQMRDGVWVDIERRMVMGPLETNDASLAMLPGRRNAAGELTYDDGIEEIKQDDKEGRVWNFTVEQTGDPNVPARLLFDPVNALDGSNLEPYSGDYYIRTDNAAGGWMAYTLPGNVMTHSEYSLEHSGYSHYFCKWVDKKDQNDPEDKTYTPNTKFVVANEYGAAISDPIVADDYTDGNGTLTADANVRWMWNEYTNIGSRAYIAGSNVANFLTATYANTTTVTFEDKGEWVYEKDLEEVKVGDVLNAITANYAGKEPQQLLEETYQENGLVMLESAGDARVSSYTVRVVYDFKINQTLCYLIPTGNAVTTSIDVIIERINQDEEGQATQVAATITPADKEKGLTVYGVITLTKDHITDPEKSEHEALTYWISFPFDVRLGDIFGFGEVGKYWMIKYYDGAERAEKGWFLDTETFWKYFTNTNNILKANTGYVLSLNKSLRNPSNTVYDNTSTLKLYFPSEEPIKTDITGDLVTAHEVIPHKCNITSPLDRTTADSDWNLIGVPSYAGKDVTANENIKYFYKYDFVNNSYDVNKNAGDMTFRPMHAYMVQFGGTINWKTFIFTENGSQQLAARKNAEQENYNLRLELQQNGKKADQTFIELQDEEATALFDMNIDLTKMFNADANIYTIIPTDIDPVQAAANVLPIANTVIPVGVQIATAGEYTFAMPDGTDGIVVELIDYETNTTTNLMLDEYTVNLTAGTNEARFALHVKPNKVTTSLEDGEITTTNGKVRKFLIDGVLYLQKDGNIYDAQGRCVQ